MKNVYTKWDGYIINININYKFAWKRKNEGKYTVV